MKKSTEAVRDLIEEREVKEGSFKLGLLLALSIGILNACTYLTRGHVFASSQSGNLLYLGLDIAKGDFSSWLKYLFPPFMYAAGIIIAEHFRDKRDLVHWKRYPFALEICVILLATFLPKSWNAVANPIFGLACGLQTITFKHIREVPVATVFINGSFQNAIVHMTKYVHIHDADDAFRFVLYSGIVAAYLAGIIAGGVLANWMDQYVSLVSVVVLIFCAIYLVHPKKSDDRD